MLWTTLVLSKQSMQFVRKTPCCTFTTASPTAMKYLFWGGGGRRGRGREGEGGEERRGEERRGEERRGEERRGEERRGEERLASTYSYIHCNDPREFILLLFQPVHQDGETIPPHLTALLMEVKGLIAASGGEGEKGEGGEGEGEEGGEG